MPVSYAVTVQLNFSLPVGHAVRIVGTLADCSGGACHAQVPSQVKYTLYSFVCLARNKRDSSTTTHRHPVFCESRVYRHRAQGSSPAQRGNPPGSTRHPKHRRRRQHLPRPGTPFWCWNCLQSSRCPHDCRSQSSAQWPGTGACTLRDGRCPSFPAFFKNLLADSRSSRHLIVTLGGHFRCLYARMLPLCVRCHARAPCTALS